MTALHRAADRSATPATRAVVPRSRAAHGGGAAASAGFGAHTAGVAHAGPGVGLVETSIVQLLTHGRDEPFPLELGGELTELTLAYETYGELNAARDNCVLVCHALTGDAHAAGRHDTNDHKPGWWDGMIGPGRPIDTDRFFVVCPNVLGSRYGTTGPTSINPNTGAPFGENFPLVTIDDIVRAHGLLLDMLGVRSPHAVIGGSLGGMQALAWLHRYPERSRRIVPLCAAAALSAQALALNAIGRRAVLADLERNAAGGSPDSRAEPSTRRDSALTGLGIARMLAHVSYLSRVGMDFRFTREPSPFGGPLSKFDQGLPVETYLDHQARTFADRFDPLTYLYLTAAMDRCDLRFDDETFRSIRSIPAAGSDSSPAPAELPRLSFISGSTDWLYPPAQSEDAANRLRDLGLDAHHLCVQTHAGHDGFLVDLEAFGSAIVRALA